MIWHADSAEVSYFALKAQVDAGPNQILPPLSSRPSPPLPSLPLRYSLYAVPFVKFVMSFPRKALGRTLKRKRSSKMAASPAKQQACVQEVPIQEGAHKKAKALGPKIIEETDSDSESKLGRKRKLTFQEDLEPEAKRPDTTSSKSTVVRTEDYENYHDLWSTDQSFITEWEEGDVKCPVEGCPYYFPALEREWAQAPNCCGKHYACKTCENIPKNGQAYCTICQEAITVVRKDDYSDDFEDHSEDQSYTRGLEFDDVKCPVNGCKCHYPFTEREYLGYDHCGKHHQCANYCGGIADKGEDCCNKCLDLE